MELKHALTPETLDDITKLAAAAYTPKQVGYILGIPPGEFMAMVKDEESDVNMAYFKGFYSSEHEVRASIIKLATNGSSPAQTLATKMFDETRKTLLKDEAGEEI